MEKRLEKLEKMFRASPECGLEIFFLIEFSSDAKLIKIWGWKTNQDYRQTPKKIIFPAKKHIIFTYPDKYLSIFGDLEIDEDEFFLKTTTTISEPNHYQIEMINSEDDLFRWLENQKKQGKEYHLVIKKMIHLMSEQK